MAALDRTHARPDVSTTIDWQRDPNLLRNRITNSGPEDVSAGRVVNLIVPASWKFVACTASGKELTEQWTSMKSDEEVLLVASRDEQDPEEHATGSVPGMLLSTRLPDPIDVGLTHTLWFAVFPNATYPDVQTRLVFVLVGFGGVYTWLTVDRETHKTGRKTTVQATQLPHGSS